MGSIAISVLLNSNIYLNGKAKEHNIAVEPKKSMMQLNQSSNFYFLDVLSMYDVFYSFNLFETPERNMYKNFYYLGGWSTFSPLTNERLKTHDIKKPFKALVERRDTFLIDNTSVDLKATYIREHYYPNIFWCAYDKFCDRFIFAFSQNFYGLKQRDDSQLSKVICTPAENKRNDFFWISGSVDISNFAIANNYLYLELKNSEGKLYTYRVEPREEASSINTYDFEVGIEKSELQGQSRFIARAIVCTNNENGYAQDSIPFELYE